MTTLFLIFVALAVFHFVVEGIIAPSERSKIRLQLFGLRDEVRMAKIEHKHELDNELFDHLQSHANKSIHLLHNYNLVGLFQTIQAKRRNDSLYRTMKARMARFDSLVDGSKVPGMREMHLRSVLYTGKGFFYNSLGWLPYVAVPILAGSAALVLTSMFKRAQKRCVAWLTGLLEMPEGDFRRYFPSSSKTEIA